MSIVLIILYVLSTAGGLTLIKLGTAEGAPIAFVDSAIKLNINPVVILGMILYGLSFILYIYLISRFQLGYIVPLTTGIVYGLVLLGSFLIFHEVFTVLKLIAISLILAGVILLTLNK